MDLNTQKHHMPEALLSALFYADNIVNNYIINYFTVINVHCTFISHVDYVDSRPNLLICIRNAHNRDFQRLRLFYTQPNNSILLSFLYGYAPPDSKHTTLFKWTKHLELCLVLS